MPQMLEFFVVAAIALIVTAYGPNDLVNTTRICGDRDYISAGDYTLVNNIWGPGLQDGTKAVGFQCATFDRRNTTIKSVAFTINYKWSLNKGFVKGYTYMQQNYGTGHKINDIYSIPSTWDYSVNDNSNLDYNIAYSLYTGKTNYYSGPYNNEIMVWLSSQYMKPKSSHVNAAYQSVPIFSNISINGYKWDLYQGVGGTGPNATGLNVLSFYNAGAARTNYKGDMKLFLSYLVNKKLILGTDYLDALRAGSEVIKADNTTIKTTYFAIDVIPDIVYLSSTLKSTLSSSTSKITSAATKTWLTTGRTTSSTSSRKSTSATTKTIGITKKATSTSSKKSTTAKPSSAAKSTSSVKTA